MPLSQSGGSNLSTAVNPQTQAALQSLMEREMQMKLANQQATLQLKLQERQMKDNFDGRDHERKMQLEDMKFKQSAMGQQQAHEASQQEKQLKQQQEQWDKYNALQERMQKERITTEEKAAKRQIQLQLRLQEIALIGASADAKERRAVAAKLTENRQKLYEMQKATILAQMQFAEKSGLSAAELRNMHTKMSTSAEAKTKHLQNITEQVSPQLALLFSKLHAPQGQDALLDEADPSFGKKVKMSLRGVERGKVRDKTSSGDAVDKAFKRDAVAKATQTMNPLEFMLQDEPISVTATNPVEALKRLAPEWAKTMAPAVGVDTKTLEAGLNAMAAASYALQSGPMGKEEAKKVMDSFFQNEAQAGKVDPEVWTALMKQMAQTADGEIIKFGEDDIKLEAENPDDPEAMLRVQARAGKAAAQMMAGFDNVLQATGHYADAEDTAKLLTEVGHTIQTQKPAEIARRLKETPGYGKALGMTDGEIDKFVKNLGIEELEAMARTNAMSGLELENVIAQGEIEAEVAGAGASQGAIDAQQRALQDLVSRGGF